MARDYGVLNMKDDYLSSSIWAIRDLNDLSTEQWRAWLLRGIMTWSRTEIGSPERIRAFAPLASNHNDGDGPGQLATALKRIGLSPVAEVRLNQALASAIETWTPTDTMSTAVFLLRLAGHVSWSVSPGPQMRVLLSRALYVSEEERADFARAVSFAATQRLSNEDIRRIAQRLRALQLDTPDALIEIVTRLAVNDSSSLIDDIEAMLPDVQNMPPSDPLMEIFSDLLVDRLGMEQVLRVAYFGGTTTHKFLQRILKHRISSTEDSPRFLRDEIVFRDKYTNEVVRIALKSVSEKPWIAVQNLFKISSLENRVFNP